MPLTWLLGDSSLKPGDKFRLKSFLSTELKIENERFEAYLKHLKTSGLVFNKSCRMQGVGLRWFASEIINHRFIMQPVMFKSMKKYAGILLNTE